jgi:NAD(P)-dependent dehydrogenase (short-subunit alcohol dehydrogenase family)
MRPKGGKIINFGSNGGTSSPVGFLAYGSNKEAIRAATRVAAREWGQYGINVNTIDPLAMTPGLAAGAPPEALQMIAAMAPLGRIASAEDIAQIALFLASSDSDVLTGYTFFGDCGLCIDTAR